MGRLTDDETPIPELTQDLITETIKRTEAQHCPTNERCFVFPHPLGDALARYDAHHRCRVGWMMRDAGGESCEILLDLTTGMARLWRHPN